MSSNHSIIIVDDAKFSAAIVSRRLKKAGFTDLRTAHHASEVLDMIEERKCDLLIADWLMPDINGIELCKKVRDFDKRHGHFTYCLLITAKESDDALGSALQQGLDDFILKSELNEQLVPRAYAGLRTSDELNQAIKDQLALREKVAELEKLQGRDKQTGLGNTYHAKDTLQRVLKHTASRGGATSYMTLQILNWDSLKDQYLPVVCNELVEQVSKKLRSLVRPMDEVCRLNENEYAVIAHFKDIADCNLSTYRRIYQGMDKQSFQTSSGYITVNVGCAICSVDHQSIDSASLEKLSEFNRTQLVENSHSTFVMSNWE